MRRAHRLIQREFSNPPYTESIITLGRAAAASTGIVAQSGSTVENVRVIGFGTCIAEQGPKPLTQNVDCDGGTGIHIHNSDVPMIVNTAVGNDATEAEASFKLKSITWDGTNSEYQVSVFLPVLSTLPGYHFNFTDQDVVWVWPQSGAGAESTNRQWHSLGTDGNPVRFLDITGGASSGGASGLGESGKLYGNRNTPTDTRVLAGASGRKRHHRDRNGEFWWKLLPADQCPTLGLEKYA
jgi:hypothetical protein